MRLLSFQGATGPRVGIAVDDGVVDVTGRIGVSSMRLALDGDLAAIRPLASLPADVSLDDLNLLPPVPDPIHIVGVGLNTHSHFAETLTIPGRESDQLPKKPRLFTRSPLSQVGHGAQIWLPKVSKFLDYEGELAVVIGRTMRYVPVEAALDFVAGYACYNDGSVRDYQMHSSQATAGKNFPRSGAFGPWLMTVDEAPPVEKLRLTTR